jgi:hypothetical protein
MRSIGNRAALNNGGYQSRGAPHYSAATLSAAPRPAANPQLI